MDPNDLERMIKTNVHPYIYMTKYALPHFISNADSQSHRNAMIYVSSSAAYAQCVYMGPYAATKSHNLYFANMIRQYCAKSEHLNGLLTIQTVHPGAVTTALNNHL